MKRNTKSAVRCAKLYFCCRWRGCCATMIFLSLFSLYEMQHTLPVLKYARILALFYIPFLSLPPTTKSFTAAVFFFLFRTYMRNTVVLIYFGFIGYIYCSLFRPGGDTQVFDSTSPALTLMTAPAFMRRNKQFFPDPTSIKLTI